MGATESDELVVGGGGERLEAYDVAQDDQPHQLRRGGLDPHRVDRSARRSDPAEQRAADELAQHRRALLAGERRPHQPEHRGAELRVGPDAEEHPHQPLPQLGRVAGENLRQPLGRVERQLHRRDEDLLLAAEVVVHECGVHVGLPGDAAHGRAGVPLVGELLAGGIQDRGAPVTAVCGTARPAAGGPGRPASGHDAHHAVSVARRRRQQPGTERGGAHPFARVRPSALLQPVGQPPAWVSPLTLRMYGADCCTCSVGSS